MKGTWVLYTISATLLQIILLQNKKLQNKTRLTLGESVHVHDDERVHVSDSDESTDCTMVLCFLWVKIYETQFK